MCFSKVKGCKKNLCANYLELSLKFGEPSAKNENFLWAIVVALKLLAPVVIFLQTAIKDVSVVRTDGWIVLTRAAFGPLNNDRDSQIFS